MIGRFTMDLLGPVPGRRTWPSRPPCSGRAGPCRCARPSSATSPDGCSPARRRGRSRIGGGPGRRPANRWSTGRTTGTTRSHRLRGRAATSTPWSGCGSRARSPARARPWCGCGRASRSCPARTMTPAAAAARLRRLRVRAPRPRWTRREWNFMNTELTVHLVRPPVGEWVCLRRQHHARRPARSASPPPRCTTSRASSPARPRRCWCAPRGAEGAASSERRHSRIRARANARDQ